MTAIAQPSASALGRAVAGDAWLAFRWARYALASTVLSGTVLDVGCELGLGARALTRSARRTLAVDAREDHAAAARDALAGSPALALRADGRRLPLADAACDGVCLFNVLSVTQRPGELLAEGRRVLGPDGVLLLSDARRDAAVAPPDPAELRTGPATSWCVLGVRVRGSRAWVTGVGAPDRWWLAIGSPDPDRLDRACHTLRSEALDLVDAAAALAHAPG